MSNKDKREMSEALRYYAEQGVKAIVGDESVDLTKESLNDPSFKGFDVRGTQTGHEFIYTNAFIETVKPSEMGISGIIKTDDTEMDRENSQVHFDSSGYTAEGYKGNTYREAIIGSHVTDSMDKLLNEKLEDAKTSIEAFKVNDNVARILEEKAGEMESSDFLNGTEDYALSEGERPDYYELARMTAPETSEPSPSEQQVEEAVHGSNLTGVRMRANADPIGPMGEKIDISATGEQKPSSKREGDFAATGAAASAIAAAHGAKESDSLELDESGNMIARDTTAVIPPDSPSEPASEPKAKDGYREGVYYPDLAATEREFNEVGSFDRTDISLGDDNLGSVSLPQGASILVNENGGQTNNDGSLTLIRGVNGTNYDLSGGWVRSEDGSTETLNIPQEKWMSEDGLKAWESHIQAKEGSIAEQASDATNTRGAAVEEAPSATEATQPQRPATIQNEDGSVGVWNEDLDGYVSVTGATGNQVYSAVASRAEEASMSFTASPPDVGGSYQHQELGGEVRVDYMGGGSTGMDKGNPSATEPVYHKGASADTDLQNKMKDLPEAVRVQATDLASNAVSSKVTDDSKPLGGTSSPTMDYSDKTPTNEIG